MLNARCSERSRNEAKGSSQGLPFLPVILCLMKTVLVLGSGGRLGQALKYLVSQGNGSDFNFIFSTREVLDLLSLEATLAYFSKHNPTIVLNFAAQVTPRLDRTSGGADQFLSNLRLFQNVYSASLEVGAELLIQVSSYHTFSSNISPPYPSHSPPELAELNFEAPYAAAKSAEYLLSSVANCSSQKTRLNVKIVSMPNLFGPFGPALQASEHFIGATIRRMLTAIDEKVNELELYGNELQQREYLYTLDAADQIIQRYIRKQDHRQYSVISSGTRLTQRECWDLIAEATGYSGRTVSFSDQQTRNDMYFEEATFVPTSFRDALHTTVGWYSERKATTQIDD